MPNYLKTIIEKHKQGSNSGIYSVCSSNRYVIEAAILQAKKDESVLLVESTSNQVDQFGGYSGMTPADFAEYISKLCRKMDFPYSRVILGGDHLGPNVWQDQQAAKAMVNALDQVKAYAQAGFTKIHLDTSMRCADDPGELSSALNPATIAKRAAQLCEVVENSITVGAEKPLYIIGTEVPIPGGAQEELDELLPTSIENLQETIDVTHKAFISHNLEEAWERVIAVVVQPGVEFGHATVVEYDREKAQALSKFIENDPRLVYEAHSTDYQVKEKLRQMVEDHFAILKVGPGFTYVFREAVFALARIEAELLPTRSSMDASQVMDTVELAMLNNPKYWRKHYHGSEAELALARKYSLSDRIRYYWQVPEVNTALEKLIHNLKENKIPMTLLSQYLPNQYHAVRNGEIKNEPIDLIHHKILESLNDYSYAINP